MKKNQVTLNQVGLKIGCVINIKYLVPLNIVKIKNIFVVLKNWNYVCEVAFIVDTIINKRVAFKKYLLNDK